MYLSVHLPVYLLVRAYTVRARLDPFRPVKTASIAAGGGFDGTERAGTRSDSRKQGRNSADGCGEDRACVVGSSTRTACMDCLQPLIVLTI